MNREPQIQWRHKALCRHATLRTGDELAVQQEAPLWAMWVTSVVFVSSGEYLRDFKQLLENSLKEVEESLYIELRKRHSKRGRKMERAGGGGSAMTNSLSVHV
jgi:hypothetical protein